MLSLPDFSNLYGGFGELAHHALRMSLQIALVLEKALRSHSHDLVIYERKEGTHLLSIRPLARCFTDGLLLNPLHNCMMEVLCPFGRKLKFKEVKYLAQVHTVALFNQAHLTPSNYTAFASSLYLSA